MTGADAGTRHDVVVVGAGASGLAAAWDLRARNPVVLEASDRPGGRLLSSPRGSYWLNLGAHVFPPDDSETGRILSELGLYTAIVPGSVMGVALNGKVIATGPSWTYPLRLPLPPAGRLSLMRVGLRLRRAGGQRSRDAFAASVHPVDPSERRLGYLGDQTFADWLGQVHPEVRALLAATTTRVTGSVTQMSAGSAVEHLGQATSGQKSTFVRALPGGAARFTDELANRLGPGLITGARVDQVLADGDSVRVRYHHAGAIRQAVARHVILATPAYVSHAIAPTLPEATRAALRAIPYGPFVVLSLLTNETHAMPWDEIYAVAVAKKRFNVLMNQASVLRQPGQPRLPGGSLMLYASADLATPWLGESDDRITDAFIEDLLAVFPAAAGIIAEAIVHRWPQGAPYVAPGRHRLQQALTRPLGRLHLAGDYFDYASIEAGVASATVAARKIDAALRGPDRP